MGRLCYLAGSGFLVEGIDSLAVRAQSVHQVHGDGEMIEMKKKKKKKNISRARPLMGTDHFADLLGQVGKKNESHKSLNERQRSMTPTNGTNGRPTQTADFDFLEKLSSPGVSPKVSPKVPSEVSSKVSPAANDLDTIFSAFDAPQAKVESNKDSHSDWNTRVETEEKVGQKVSDSLFLDDEFEDLVSVDVSRPSSEPKENNQFSIPTHSDFTLNDPVNTESSQRDRALAELVDMGFSVSQSSAALDATDSGHNAEQAVGFLLNDTQTSSQSDDFGSIMSNLSEGFMNKASMFFDQGRNTIAKGLESYKDSQRSETPKWMNEQKRPPVPVRRSNKPSLPARRGEQGGDIYGKPSLPIRRSGTRSDSFKEDRPFPTGRSHTVSNSIKTRTSVPQKPQKPQGPLVPIDPSQLEVFKAANQNAKELFLKGDYAASQMGYEKALKALPSGHLLQVLVYSNLATCLSKLGDVKQSVVVCDNGLVLLREVDISEVEIDGKKAKEFWLKLVQRKAQGLEQQELYARALDCYTDLIVNGGCSKLIMDGKRRCMDILNPKPVKKQAVPSVSVKTAKPQTPPVQIQTNKQNEALEDATREKISQWKTGKEDNLRALISSLHLVLWDEANWVPIGMADLISPKKVKLAYMKAVSKTHPDKVSGKSLEQKLVAHDVFILINQAWEKFKETNDV